jgi:uncharacterized 2Fe-2S/4Fe-4S cluster protein (DUF4445 family)
MLITLDTYRQSRQVEIASDHRDLASELRRAGVPLNTRCGGIGLCDGCMVEPMDGRFEHRTSGVVLDGRYAGSIRACQHRVLPSRDARVRVADRNLLASRPAVERDFSLAGPDSLAPVWRQVCRDGHWVSEHWHSGAFHETLRRSTAVDRPLGLAIDVGTTTVALLLVDLTTGEILDRAADFNHQIALGDNVLTRIGLCLSDPSMLATLQRAVIDQSILPLVRQCLDRTGLHEADVVCAAVSGNTTMLHLLAGIDPSPMGVAPFRASFLDHRLEHGLFAPLDATVHLLPGASAYVGSDLSAGAVACAMHHNTGPALLVDVGTNGEMILRHGDRLLGCATAAGPAFEGSGLTCGVRAADGAASHIRFLEREPWFEIDTINDARPVGLCGSFYVDFLAQARRIGLLDETGHFCPSAVPGLASHFGRSACAGRTFRVAGPADERAVVVSEGDIAKLLAAKAAIAAGMLTLLERQHLTPADLRVLHLAGGFGAKVDLASAVACGLIPGIDPGRVNVVGNSSLAGAWLALLDVTSLQRMADLSRRIEIVELNQDPGFEDRYLDHLVC